MRITDDTPITLDTGAGAPVALTLGAFATDNSLDGDELQRIVADLSGTGEHVGGGGVAPFYTLRLARLAAVA